MNTYERRWQTAMYVALIIAIGGMAGSLYFSEILHWVPCKLCWFQRIALYPLVPIIATGIFQRDQKVTNYVLPLSIIGGAIAFYHNLLQYNVLSETVSSCSGGVSCTTEYLSIFGFITIPLLSFLAFALITGIMLAARKNLPKEQ